MTEIQGQERPTEIHKTSPAVTTALVAKGREEDGVWRIIGGGSSGHGAIRFNNMVLIGCPCIVQAKPTRELASSSRDPAQISDFERAGEK